MWCLLGSCCRFPAAGNHVHQIHSDLPSSGAVLWPDCSPTETTSPSSCSWRCHGKSSWAEEWDGQPGTLRVPLLRRCAFRSQANSCKLHYIKIYLFMHLFIIKLYTECKIDSNTAAAFVDVRRRRWLPGQIKSRELLNCDLNQIVIWICPSLTITGSADQYAYLCRFSRCVFNAEWRRNANPEVFRVGEGQSIERTGKVARSDIVKTWSAGSRYGRTINSWSFLLLLKLHTLWSIKRWLYTCDHNSGF